MLKHFDGIQVGLTATPCVTDGDFDEEEDKLFVRDTLRFLRSLPHRDSGLGSLAAFLAHGFAGHLRLL